MADLNSTSLWFNSFNHRTQTTGFLYNLSNTASSENVTPIAPYNKKGLLTGKAAKKKAEQIAESAWSPEYNWMKTDRYHTLSDRLKGNVNDHQLFRERRGMIKSRRNKDLEVVGVYRNKIILVVDRVELKDKETLLSDFMRSVKIIEKDTHSNRADMPSGKQLIETIVNSSPMPVMVRLSHDVMEAFFSGESSGQFFKPQGKPGVFDNNYNEIVWYSNLSSKFESGKIAPTWLPLAHEFYHDWEGIQAQKKSFSMAPAYASLFPAAVGEDPVEFMKRHQRVGDITIGGIENMYDPRTEKRVDNIDDALELHSDGVADEENRATYFERAIGGRLGIPSDALPQKASGEGIADNVKVDDPIHPHEIEHK